MGAAGAWGIAAVALAAAAGGALGIFGARAWKRRDAAATALAADKRERAELILMRASAPLRPAARRLMAVPAVRQAAEGAVLLLEERGRAAQGEMLVSLLLAASALAAAIATLVSLSPACGIAAGCLAAFGGVAYVRNRASKRSMAMREQIPDALRCMGTCFRSGLSLLQTLQQTAKECGGALGQLFGVAARRLKMGAAPAEALAVMRSGDEVPELSFIAVALDVQHQSGGSIAPVLETARDSVVSELDLMRSLRVQTAQAKLSASIVTVMPFILVALFSLLSPDFLEPFFSSLAGMALLALALIMQLSGVLAVRRMLRIDAG